MTPQALDEIVVRTEALRSERGRVIIAIDGRGGAGSPHSLVRSWRPFRGALTLSMTGFTSQKLRLCRGDVSITSDLSARFSLPFDPEVMGSAFFDTTGDTLLEYLTDTMRIRWSYPMWGFSCLRGVRPFIPRSFPTLIFESGWIRLRRSR